MRISLFGTLMQLQNSVMGAKIVKAKSAGRLPRYWDVLMGQRYLITSLLLVALMISHSLYGRWVGDFWEHSAVVRELSTHPLHPLHPLLNVNKTHHFFSPYLLSVGLLSLFGSLTAIDALTIAGVLNLLLLLISIRLFIQCFFDKHQDAIGFYTLILVLFLWSAEAWDWSGFIHFNVLGNVLPYPSTFAIAATFLIFTLYHRALDRLGKVKLLVAGMLTAVVILTHPTTAVFAFIGILSISLHHYKRIGLSAIAVGLLLLAGAVFLALLWPYYSLFDLAKANNPEFHTQSYVLYQRVYVIWPTLLLAPFALALLISRLRQNTLDALVLMLCAAILVYIAGYISEQYGVGRIIAFIAILLQMSLGAFLAQLETKIRVGKSWYALPIIAIVLFAGMVALHPRNKEVLRRAYRGYQGLRYSYSDYEILGSYVGQYDVILSELETSWMIPTYGGKLIATTFLTHWIDDHEERKNDVQRFFSKGVKQSELDSIIDHYQVDYILINRSTIEDSQIYYNIGDLVYENKDSILIKVH